MNRKSLFVFAMGMIFSLFPPVSFAQDQKVIQLPPPAMNGGQPLLECLKNRHSTREYDPDRKLSLQVLSDLLWAADGVNRPDGKRTAPSAANLQNIDIYLATAEGLFRYDAPEHILKVLGSKDIRAATGQQPFVKSAPLNLIYVADYFKAEKLPQGGNKLPLDEWSFAGAGSIAQNVYLFCASEDLGTVVRATIDRKELKKALNLRPEQHVILAQSVGYPAH